MCGDQRLRCEVCDGRVTGETGVPVCEWHAEDDCDCGPWDSGAWYYDGEEYRCDSCGAVYRCRVDDDLASLELSDEHADDGRAGR